MENKPYTLSPYQNYYLFPNSAFPTTSIPYPSPPTITSKLDTYTYFNPYYSNHLYYSHISLYKYYYYYPITHHNNFS